MVVLVFVLPLCWAPIRQVIPGPDAIQCTCTAPPPPFTVVLFRSCAWSMEIAEKAYFDFIAVKFPFWNSAGWYSFNETMSPKWTVSYWCGLEQRSKEQSLLSHISSQNPAAENWKWGHTAALSVVQSFSDITSAISLLYSVYAFCRSKCRLLAVTSWAHRLEMPQKLICCFRCCNTRLNECSSPSTAIQKISQCLESCHLNV